ncbi:MAG TPA: hypothetical protein VJ327_11105 [Patescibacteria group bacterium]|nr:hypothetical protein [Patescibacteria group bacterium]
MGYTFDENRALKADDGGYISTGGIYVGHISEMVAFNLDSGAGGVELSFESIGGERCSFVTVYTKNKNGSENFAKGKIDSMIGILGLSEVPHVKNGEKITFPSVCNKPIAFALQREDYIKQDQTIGWKMNLLHFFYADTLQTFKERKENKPASVSKREIKDALINTESKQTSNAAKAFVLQDNDDLPF